METKMARLSKREIEEHRAWMENWHNPDDMKAYCVNLMNEMASDTYGVDRDLFNQAGVDFITEAYLSAVFAQLYSAKQVRLVSGVRPDFQLKMENGIESWEVAEGIEEGRKRGDEYTKKFNNAKQGLSRIENDPVENWLARAGQIPSVLEELATKKSNKTYADDTRLLIYLNIGGTYGTGQKETESRMIKATTPAKDAFAEIWVYWDERAYCLWVNGKSQQIP